MLQISKVKVLGDKTEITKDKVYEVLKFNGKEVLIENDVKKKVWIDFLNLEIIEDYFLP